MIESSTPNRRQFLQIAALAGGATLLTGLPSVAGRVAAQHATTEALLLSCMDFRLMDEIERYMSGRGLRDKYDHIVLAGASLGAVTEKYPAWGQTFWDHVGLSVSLHHIQKLIVMDHRDCGAYKLLLGDAHLKDPTVERETHAVQLRKLKGMVAERHRKIAVEMLLMGLDGRAEVIT